MDITVEHLCMTYGKGENAFTALEDINCNIKLGEFVCIMGESGSGKSTLLNLIAGFDNATSGRVMCGNTNIIALSEDERAKFRQDNISFIFQSFCLLNDLSALENVMMPLLIKGYSEKKSRERAIELIESLDLGTKLNNKPEELSGGQQQRIAIARAIISEGEIILADEPTGKLDSKNAHEVLNILKKVNKECKKTIIMVTHSAYASKFADRIIYLKDGKLINRHDGGEVD